VTTKFEDMSRFDQVVVYHLRNTYDSIQHAPKFEADKWTSGRLELAKHQPMPSVVWVRMGGALEPTDKKGPIHTEGGGWFSPIFEERANVQCHILGCSARETEEIWDSVLHAVKKVCGANAVYGRYAWTTQEADGAGHVFNGAEKIIQEFVLPMIVPGDRGRTATITGQSHDALFVVDVDNPEQDHGQH
jgi:hypothetical protein